MDATIEWLFDVTPASWLASQLHPFLTDTGSLTRAGFESYARIFHLVEHDHLGDRRQHWADIPAEAGPIVHPEMQFHEICGSALDLFNEPILAFGELPQ